MQIANSPLFNVAFSSVHATKEERQQAVEDSVPKPNAIEAPESAEKTNSAESSQSGEKKERDGYPDPGSAEQIKIDDQIEEMAKQDRAIRTHERIHAALAGPYGGAPQFQFRRGPDGVLYAVSGQVSLDASVIPGDPEATIRKAQAIKSAALGPADPSSADRAVAARASAMSAKATIELARLVTEDSNGDVGSTPIPDQVPEADEDSGLSLVV